MLKKHETRNNFQNPAPLHFRRILALSNATAQVSLRLILTEVRSTEKSPRFFHFLPVTRLLFIK